MSEPFSSKYQLFFHKQLSMSAYCEILTVLFSEEKKKRFCPSKLQRKHARYCTYLLIN